MDTPQPVDNVEVQIIPDMVEAMREVDLAAIAPGHCTGWRTVNTLAGVLGESKLAPLAVGKRFVV